MTNIAVLGSQFGDEGKGRIVHWMSPNFDWIIRFNGGANAGHTIYRDGKKFVHNLMPSFDWRSERPKAFLGSGMVINLPQLHLEVKNLSNIDPSLPKRVYVDPDAFLVLESHMEEDKKFNGHLGSTNRGIGPAYKSKIERKGLRIKDLLDGKSGVVDNWTQLAFSQLKELGVNFKSSLELLSEMKCSSILFEGAQAVMLDINHGIYPYVSCSDATIGGIIASGFASIKLDKVYGVAKCYTTKVGEGPFPSEIHGQPAEDLRKMGDEFGSTTGRPRRIGWLDLPALRYACQKSGITHLILTKFDILNGMPKVPVCIAYNKKPMCPSDFFNTQTLITEMDGWTDAKQQDSLRSFIDLVELSTGYTVAYVSCGVNDNDVIKWQT